MLSLENDLRPGDTARRTVSLDTSVRFIKVLVENPNDSAAVANAGIAASIGG
jgi:hypothetical protein